MRDQRLRWSRFVLLSQKLIRRVIMGPRRMTTQEVVFNSPASLIPLKRSHFKVFSKSFEIKLNISGVSWKILFQPFCYYYLNFKWFITTMWLNCLGSPQTSIFWLFKPGGLQASQSQIISSTCVMVSASFFFLLLPKVGQIQLKSQSPSHPIHCHIFTYRQPLVSPGH